MVHVYPMCLIEAFATEIRLRPSYSFVIQNVQNKYFLTFRAYKHP